MNKAVIGLALLLIFTSVGVLPFINPVYATTYFSDDFETGNFSAWSSTGGVPHIVNNNMFAFNGTYCMNATDNGGNQIYCQETLSDNYSLVDTRFYFRIPALPSSDDIICRFYDQNNVGEIFLALNTSGVLYTSEWAGTTINGTTPISINTWHSIEFSRFYDPSGFTKVWLDNNTQINDPSTTYHTNLIHMIQYGKIDNVASFTDYIDTVVIADSFIGPYMPPIFLTIISPVATTYYGNVNVTLLAYGGTGVAIEWNVQYSNGTFVYLTNWLYGGSVNITGLTPDTYTLGCYAYNTEGSFVGPLFVTFTVSGAIPVVLTIVSPAATAYTNGNINITLSASGGTGITMNYNFWNGSAYRYPVNQWYTGSIVIPSFQNGSYAMGVYAQNLEGGVDFEMVSFTVAIPPGHPTIPYLPFIITPATPISPTPPAAAPRASFLLTTTQAALLTLFSGIFIVIIFLYVRRRRKNKE